MQIDVDCLVIAVVIRPDSAGSCVAHRPATKSFYRWTLVPGHPEPRPTGMFFMNASTAWIFPS
jgi:hypothetical protein